MANCGAFISHRIEPDARGPWNWFLIENRDKMVGKEKKRSRGGKGWKEEEEELPRGAECLIRGLFVICVCGDWFPHAAMVLEWERGWMPERERVRFAYCIL